MKDYKRLTDKDTDGRYTVFEEDCKCPFENVLNAINRLGKIEDLIEQGLILALPCKVGDKFYGIQGDSYFKYTVYAIVINNKGIWLETVYEMRFLYGSDAFLTKSEAEARLQELRGEK